MPNFDSPVNHDVDTPFLSRQRLSIEVRVRPWLWGHLKTGEEVTKGIGLFSRRTDPSRPLQTPGYKAKNTTMLAADISRFFSESGR
jgi:hypothetical protein